MYEALANLGMTGMLAIYPERQHLRFTRPDRRKAFKRVMLRELFLSASTLTVGAALMLALRDPWQSLCRTSIAGLPVGSVLLLAAYTLVARVCGRITDLKTATFDRSRRRFYIPAGLCGGALLAGSMLFALVWLPPVIAVGPFTVFVLVSVVSGMRRRHL
jgi:hypothetical protein